MPLQQRVRLEQEHDVTEPAASTGGQRRQFGSEHDQRELLPAGNAGRMRLFALEDTELLPQEQDLKIFVMVGSTP